MVNYNNREIFFSLKDYVANYNTLLDKYLSKHEDFDEKQFVEYEIDLYEICKENSNLTSYSEGGLLKFNVNNGNCRFLITKIYDTLVTFKKEDDGWDLELALKYQSTFVKILNFLNEKKKLIANIKGKKYNYLLTIAHTSEVRNLLTEIMYHEISTFDVINFINKHTNDENYEVFMKEFNTCCTNIFYEFMFYVNEEDIVKALELNANNLEYVYVNEFELKSINHFVKKINELLTVYNIGGFTRGSSEYTTKLVYLNNMMIDYFDGFFADKIVGFENIGHLKYIFNFLKKSNDSKDYGYNQLPVEEFKISNKKYPAKYHALTYMIELVVKSQKPPLDPDGSFKKDLIIKEGIRRCEDSGQNFYKFVKDYFLDISNNKIKKSIFSTNWKEIVLDITEDKADLENFIQNNNL
jgi:hypothetical protein